MLLDLCNLEMEDLEVAAVEFEDRDLVETEFGASRKGEGC